MINSDSKIIDIYQSQHSPFRLFPIHGTEEHLADILKLLGVGHIHPGHGLCPGLCDSPGQSETAPVVVHYTGSHGPSWSLLRIQI